MWLGGSKMKAVIYFSFSRNQSCKKVASQIEGDHFEINPNTLVKGVYFFHMMLMGFRTVTDRHVVVEPFDINLDQYDEIHLVFPIWAGRPAVYVKQWLNENPFMNKKVYVYACSDSGNSEYLNDFEQYVDKSNEIVEKNTFKKDNKMV
jgi:hypothetical protein